MHLSQQEIAVVQNLISSFFKNAKGEPYRATVGQCEMFAAVTNRAYKWVWISATTRYGKSEILAMAAICLAVLYHLKVPIVAGSTKKAEKIMEYILIHLGDHPELYKGLLNVENMTNIDKLKIQANKQALKWHTGGWIYVTSVDSRSIQAEGEGVVGEGGDVVILEEAGLIKKEEQFSKIVRMSEEDRGWGKLVMSGNCIENSVFETAFNNPLYFKIKISIEQAVAEGRFSQEYLEQKKTMTTTKDWKRYYLVQFPAANEFTYFKPKKYEYLPPHLEFWGATDLALGETKKGSLVGTVILGKDKKGQFYEVDSWGEHITPDETMQRILNMQYQFQRYGIEQVQFQKYFLQQLEKTSKREGRHIPFKGISQNKKKEERIESLEPFINTGQILFKGDNELWTEMQDYPESDYFDVIDALEMCWRTATGSRFKFAIV